jgi:hypothetical protein
VPPLRALTCASAFVLSTCSGQVVFAQPVQAHEDRTIAAKLDSHIYFAARGAANAATQAALPRIRQSLELDDEGRVHVDIQALVTPALLAEIANRGGTVESSFPDHGTLRAWIPLSIAEILAARSDVTFIKPAARASTN